MAMGDGYYAVDLDGTLAEYNGWKGELHIGAPIKPMVERVKAWRAQGIKVKIFTARAADNEPEVIRAIEKWCETHIGETLEVTNVKDYQMIQLYDDRAVQVVPNSGITLESVVKHLETAVRSLEAELDALKKENETVADSVED